MAAYPAIRSQTVGLTTTKVYTQYPYTETDEFMVASTELDCGKAYALNYGSSQSIRGFVLRYSVITDAEFVILNDFWRQMAGRLGTFTFVDDDGSLWPKVRFDMDDFRPTYAALNQYSIEVRLKVTG